jgi:hypothetical protein
MASSISLSFNFIGVIFEIVAIVWAARIISYSFKKWRKAHIEHVGKSDKQHFEEERKQAIIILFLSLGVLFQGVAGFF